MNRFIDVRPQGAPGNYAIAIRYSYDGNEKHTHWGWYCGLSAMAKPPRHIIVSEDAGNSRIRRYVDAQIAETKILRDIFTDGRVAFASVVPLAADRLPVISVFNTGFLR